MKKLSLALCSVLCFTGINVWAEMVSLTTTYEDVRADVFYSQSSQKGNIQISESECSSCPHQRFEFDRSLIAKVNGKQVPLEQALNWRGVKVDLRVDNESNQAVTINRHQ